MEKIKKLSNGSISRRGKDGLYICQVTVTYEDGVIKRKNASAHTKADAQKKLKEMRMNIINSSVAERQRDIDSCTKHLYTYYLLHDWIEEKKNVEQLENTTINVHKQRIKCYIVPTFKDKYAENITPKDIIELYEKLANKVQPETIHKVHAILNNSFQKLLRDKIVSENPCKYIKLPKIKIKERKILTVNCKCKLNTNLIKKHYQ